MISYIKYLYTFIVYSINYSIKAERDLDERHKRSFIANLKHCWTYHFLSSSDYKSLNMWLEVAREKREACKTKDPRREFPPAPYACHARPIDK